MAFDENLAIRQLIAVYRDAYVRLLNVIAEKQVTLRSTAFERSLLADVFNIIRELDGAARQWSEQVIPKVYSASAEAVPAAWTAAGLSAPPLQAGFAQVHRAAVEVLVANFQDNMDDAHRFIGRTVRDQWRRAQLEVVARKVATGQTVREAKKALQERVAEEGLGAFKDKRGRVWRLDRYAEMVARTTTAEATNAGTTNQLRGMGRDLVQITDHRAPCPICAPLEGRVYSITGRTPGYPKLEVAYGDHLQIHPNCRHRAVPYIAELADDPEGDRERSNRPFDIDPRTEREKRAYEREQKQNRLRRQRRKLEEELSVLPDGEERERVRERLRRVRSEQQRLGREQRRYIDEVTGAM